VPFELEPIVNCEFLTFVLRRNKDRYYGTDNYCHTPCKNPT